MRFSLIAVALVACGPGTVSSFDGGGHPVVVGSPPDAGPPGPFYMQIRIVNDYAESIFTARITYMGVETTLMDRQRIAGNGEARSNVLMVTPGAQIDRTTLVTSLGDTTTFTGTGTVPTDGRRTLAYLYDYDVALATFRLRSVWE